MTWNRRGDDIFLTGSKAVYVFFVLVVFSVIGLGLRMGLAYYTDGYLAVPPHVEYEILRARVLGCVAGPPPNSPTPSLAVIDKARVTEGALQGCLQKPYKKFRVILETPATGESVAINLGAGVPRLQRSLAVLIKDGDTYAPGTFSLGLS